MASVQYYKKKIFVVDRTIYGVNEWIPFHGTLWINREYVQTVRVYFFKLRLKTQDEKNTVVELQLRTQSPASFLFKNCKSWQYSALCEWPGLVMAVYLRVANNVTTRVSEGCGGVSYHNPFTSQ